MITRLICIGIFIFSFTTLAAQNAWDKEGHFLTKEQYSKQQKWLEKQRKKNTKNNRKIANTDRVDYAVVFEDDVKNLSSEFIGGSFWKDGKPTEAKVVGIKTSEELAALIDKYDDEDTYNKLSPQAQWVASQLASLKPFRGIITRLRPLISKSDAAFVHSFIVTWVRSVNAGISAFNPNSEWEAGFDYVVKPFPGMDKEIETEKELYLFVRDKVLSSLRTFNSRMRALVYKGENLDELRDDFEPFYFDNKLLYSTMNVVDEQDRFIVIDRGEVHSTISLINLAMSATEYGLAYDWTGLLNTINRIALTYGFNNILTPKPGKMTAKRRIDAIRKNEELLTLLEPSKSMPAGGVVWTKSAFPWLKEGVRQGRLAWTYTRNYQGYGNEQRPLLDPRGFVPFQRIIDTSFDAVEDLIDGQGVRSSMIRGEEVKVDFERLFNEPPKDLKAFLAVGFKSGKKELVEPKTKMKYRNYAFENPDQWDLEVYKPYFPEIAQEGVPNAIRVMSQAWGGSILGAAFFPVLF